MPIRKNAVTKERFFARAAVVQNGCWLWPTEDSNGYGVASWGGRKESAHRVAYRFEYGVIPEDLWVLHSCDIRLCVNPEHLFLGTREDNMQDMWRKKRHAVGEAYRRSALSVGDVRLIRKMKPQFSHRQLAKRFGVSLAAIKDIVAGRTWRHV